MEWLDWLSFVMRWAHVITAIVWIGASFYFIWLDLSLEEPGTQRKNEGLGGELHAIHGGGIYQVGKYVSHPDVMPEKLHWFKWEAYSTWLTGTALLILIYYVKADAYLLGDSTFISTPAAGIAASVGYLVLGLALYELLMRKIARSVALQHIGTLAIGTLLSFLAYEIFSERAAILHVGAALATMMAANVFLVIIPSQKAFVAAIDAGAEVDPSLQQNAKRRSTHNNYLTLPVLFCMLSNHAAFVYAHPYAWLFVVAFSCVAALARHYFNLKHMGRNQPQVLAAAALLFSLLVWISHSTAPRIEVNASADSVQMQRIVALHCGNCHAQTPTFAGFSAPPAGMVFDRPEDLLLYRDLVKTSVTTRFMPLGNVSGMTEEERAALLGYLQQ